MNEDEENMLPDTQSVDDRVLKNVVAYVEVRCGFENRSKGVSKQLEILGAKVSSRLTKEVTHVIWKDGKPSTHERALKWGIHVLSVLWVDSCRQNQEHVDESLYQVKTGDDGSPIIGRLKRLKSMQPKQIEDQVKKSAEKFAKRQKKKTNETGAIQRPYIFIPGSPYSPLTNEPRLATPTSLADTPNSMRCALEALDRAKKLGVHETSDSPVHGERTIPLHKRLFSVTASSDDISDYERNSPERSELPGVHQRNVSVDEDKVDVGKDLARKPSKRKSETNCRKSSCAEVKSVKATRRSSRRSSVLKETLVRLLDKQTPVEMDFNSESSRCSSPVFNKNSADTVFEFVSESDSQETNLKMTHKIKNDIQKSILKKSRLTSYIEGSSHEADEKPKQNKRKRSAGKTTKIPEKFLRKTDSDTSSSSNENKKRKKRRLLAVTDLGTPPVKLVEPSRSSASDSADSGCEQLERNRNIISKKLKKINNSNEVKTDTAVPTHGLRNSLEEFTFKRRNKRQKSTKSSAPVALSSSSVTSSEEGGKEVVENIRVRKSSKEKIKKTLCMTSLSQSDQGLVISIVHKLGQFDIVDTVRNSTTHVILGRDRRTLNVLAAIARGCWLLSIEWVLKSLENGVWLPEEPFEQYELYPAAQLSRLEHYASDGTYTSDLFSSFSPMFICDDTVAPQDRIQELIEWCGGQVCSTARVARLAVGKTQPRSNLKTVDEKWVFDCINELQTCPVKDYSITP